MTSLIKEYVEFQKVEYITKFDNINPEACLSSFLPTDGLIEILSRILQEITNTLGNNEESKNKAHSFIVTSGHGTGKSHLLSVIYALQTQTTTSAAILNDPRIQPYVALLHKISPLTIWMDLSEHHNVSLPELVLLKISQEYEKRHHKHIIDPACIPGIDIIKAHELITFNIIPKEPIILILDGLTSRGMHRSIQQLNEDIEFLSFLGFSSKNAPFAIIVAAREDFFSPTSPLGIDSVLMAQTLDNFKIEWIDRSNIRELICRNILKKNSRQYQDISKIYSLVKVKLPNFHYSEKEFIEAYPYHPIIFDLAEKIRGKFHSFSLIDFVNSTFNKIASHRSISLATIENLFDFLEYEAKQNPNCKSLYQTYELISNQTIPQLEGRWKLWGKMVLKAIFLFTLADIAPTIREITDALLLFEESETGLSYNVVGMLLKQIEKNNVNELIANGEKLDRNYRFGILDSREALRKHLEQIASHIPNTDPRLCEILLFAAEGCFTDWPLRIEGTQNLSQKYTLMNIFWNGTERKGLFLCSHRFRDTKNNLQYAYAEDKNLSLQLPSLSSITAHDKEITTIPKDKHTIIFKEPIHGIEWLLRIEPIELTENEITFKPEKPTEIFWFPDKPSPEEFTHLKNVLAFHLAEQAATTGFNPLEWQLIREAYRKDLTNLFSELYIKRGKIINYFNTTTFASEQIESKNFQYILNSIFKPCLNQLYPLHPNFNEIQITNEHVTTLVRNLISGQDPSTEETQRLASLFLAPLGLALRAEHLFEFNSENSGSYFIAQTLQYLENLDECEGFVQLIYDMLHHPPTGLTRLTAQLVLATLVENNQIELFDPETNLTLKKENLNDIENLDGYSIFKVIQVHKEYSSEILTQWCRLITGNPDIPDIATGRGRNAANNAIKSWSSKWNELRISEKLDGLPNQLITTKMWRKQAWTKRRFEKIAEIFRSIELEQTTLPRGLAKIVELFREDLSLLEDASKNIVELTQFIDWFNFFINARNYLLAAEHTENSEIEEKRKTLLFLVDSPHELIETQNSTNFENLFHSFKELYIDYFATQHNQSVGPLGSFHLLKELENSTEFRNLKMLSSLAVGETSYIECLDEWIAAFQDCRCSYPVRELLQKNPCCQCNFKLSKPLKINEVILDLQTFLDLGISHQRQVLEYFKDILESKVIDSNGNKTKNAETILAILSGESLPEISQDVINEINSYFDGKIIEERLPSPIPLIAPSGRITKKQLQERIQKWLENLSDQENVLFSLNNQ